VLQFLPAVGQTAISDVGSGSDVAYFAHVGGFVFGLAAIRLFVRGRRLRDAEPPQPLY
jgi:membrane associated rhomboid family serine protease